MIISIFGYSGNLGIKITKFFLKKKYIVNGFARNFVKINNINFNYIKHDIEKNNLDRKSISILNESDVIIFSLNKLSKPKNLKHDIDKLLYYNLYYPINVCQSLDNKFRKIVMINSNSTLSKKSNFPYTISKSISKIFTTYSDQYLNKNNVFTSLIMGKLNKYRSNKLLETLDKVGIEKSYFFNKRNIIIDSEDNIF